MKALLLDSSVWIELLGKGPLLRECEKERKSAKRIVVPTLVLYEVYKKIRMNISEDRALSGIALLSQNEVQDLSREVALTAADLSLENDLSMADSIVLAHAKMSRATLVSLDNDFAAIVGTKVIRHG